MKAIIYGNDFKSCINRISATIVDWVAVEIVCDGKEARFTAMNENTSTTVKIFADVIDAGACLVYYDLLKKVCNIPGDIIIENNEDEGKFSVHSGKKHYEVRSLNKDEDMSGIRTLYAEKKSYLIASCPDHYLLSRFSALDCMRAKTTETIMRGFNIDTTAKRISVLDGYRLGISHIPEEYIVGDGKFTVDGSIFKILKSVLRGTKSKTVDIYSGEKYSCFHGDDYEIIVRNIDGVWYDIDSLIHPMSITDFSFTVDADELGKIAKEYASSAGKDDKAFILLYATEKDFATAFANHEYRTMDILEEYKPLDRFATVKVWERCFKPVFVKDACSVFSGKVEVKGNFSSNSPIYISDSDGEYSVLVLPMHADTNKLDNLLNYVKNNLA